jgi:SAM-dependent methyltransferase
MLEYTAFNLEVFNAVPPDAFDILDVGCGTGTMGKALLHGNPFRHVSGITYSSDEAEFALIKYDEVYVHDLNDFSLRLKQKYDCIIFSHVLEHTMQPLMVLKHYLQWLRPGGKVIIALPNVLFFKNRWQLLRGNFKYDPQGGFMDSTHLRFFDFDTAKALAENAGLTIENANGYGAFPLPVFRILLPALAKKVDHFACRLWPRLFSFQYVIVAVKAKV